MNRETLFIRPVQENDLISLCDIAKKVEAGLPSLQGDEHILRAKIKRSMDSFAQNIEEHGRLYFFVLEDQNTRQIIGTSAIEAQVAYHSPYYSYYVTRLIQKYNSSVNANGNAYGNANANAHGNENGKAHRNAYVNSDRHEHSNERNNTHEKTKIQIQQENKVLYLSNDYQESSLLCSLYVDPRYRSLGQGALLSRMRYLFIAEFPDFFADRLIAEMRGVYDGNLQFPFWDNLAQRFYNMDIIQAEKLLAMEGSRVITDLNPRLPIYIALLPLAAQKVIAEVNEHTKPALHVLEKEGFTYQNHIDVFDGGPIVEARKKDIRTAKTSQVAQFSGLIQSAGRNGNQNLDENKDKAKNIDKDKNIDRDKDTGKAKDTDRAKVQDNGTGKIPETLYIVCNASLNFRVALGRVEWHQDNQVYLEESVAQLLELSLGDKLRLSAFR